MKMNIDAPLFIPNRVKIPQPPNFDDDELSLQETDPEPTLSLSEFSIMHFNVKIQSKLLMKR